MPKMDPDRYREHLLTYLEAEETEFAHLTIRAREFEQNELADVLDKISGLMNGAHRLVMQTWRI